MGYCPVCGNPAIGVCHTCAEHERKKKERQRQDEQRRRDQQAAAAAQKAAARNQASQRGAHQSSPGRTSRLISVIFGFAVGLIAFALVSAATDSFGYALLSLFGVALVGTIVAENNKAVRTATWWIIGIAVVLAVIWFNVAA